MVLSSETEAPFLTTYFPTFLRSYFPFADPAQPTPTQTNHRAIPALNPNVPPHRHRLLVGRVAHRRRVGGDAGAAGVDAAG